MSPLDLPKVPLRDLLFVKLRFIPREEVRQATEPADILLTLNLLWWQQQRQDLRRYSKAFSRRGIQP